MNIQEFFSPIDISSLTPKNGFYTSHLAANMQIYISDFPDLDEIDLAIISIAEDRKSIDNQGCALGAKYIREKLYSLSQGNYTTKLADLGTIIQGASVRDTYVALFTVMEHLIKKNIVPIIIGGSHDLTYAQYLGYQNLDRKINLLVIDSHLDVDDVEAEDEPYSNSYLNKIFTHDSDYLFNFCNLGYQTYFVDQKMLSILEKLYFDAHRLGEFSDDISKAEPLIRDADMLSFDISSIRSSEAEGHGNASPNGFYGDQACRLTRYAGMSDKLSSIGFYEYNPAFDNQKQTAFLIAQMIWYFIDGFYNRKNDLPHDAKREFTKYRTTIKNTDHELIFFKSRKTDRWWMQVPYPSNKSKNERYHLVPCTYEDYQLAVNSEMPDRWWKTYQKLI